MAASIASPAWQRLCGRGDTLHCEEVLVAEGVEQQPRPFDVRTIHYLIRLMSRHDLTEIDLSEGEQRIRLRRGSSGGPNSTGRPIGESPALPAPAPAVPPPVAVPPPSAPPVVAKPRHQIKSPTPGTFYAAANPESPPFVKVGAQVRADTVVCIIEAMKVFNEITADCSGTIAAIKVENQEPVEWGQVLFEVETD
jgi:acetyl-CoA carboxylase biotin carboxyl carrier protein